MKRAALIAAIAVPLTFLAWLVGLRALARDAGLEPIGLDELAEPWGDL
jgi:hypothetical protein